ncbi:response regulator [Psychroserpens luteus]|uniref:Response regulator n=1 Tax=Psychroserpens luteus TaxID=1434066 RepID=A0ABW5ZUV4_9FLAO|nr:response regulator [Psychroserpens luteus]
MQKHILIVDDHEDVFENLERKILSAFNDFKISIADNCDDGHDLIKKHKITNPISLLILDLTFKLVKPNAILTKGKSLLAILKKENIEIPTIIYSSHDEMEHIYPVITNYHPNAYVIKSNSSSKELLFAISEVLLGKTYFSQTVHKLQLKRFQYAFSMDNIDEQIIHFLPNANTMTDWEGKILKENVPISYKSIKLRIELLCQKLEVENEKQLLLKLQRLAIL